VISSSARRVGRLHVRGSSEDDARHASTLLADALHTASLPVADTGRLIVIRRLVLGEISAGVSAAAIALHIERAMHAAIAQATVYDMAPAPRANAVVFPGRAEAIVALARLHARRAPVDAWFWPRIVEGWRHDLSRGERWLRLLDAAHDEPEAAAVASLVVAAAVGAGAEDELLGSVPPGRGITWLVRAGWSRTASASQGGPPLRLPRLRTLDRWQREWTADDDRLVWLITLLMLREAPARAAQRELVLNVAAALRETGKAGAAPIGLASSDRVLPPDVVYRDDEAPRPEFPLEWDHTSSFDLPRLPPRASKPAAPVQSRSLSVPDSQASGDLRETQERPPRSSESMVRDNRDDPDGDIQVGRLTATTVAGELTPCAGLLFVVPVLARLGFGDAMASSPDLLRTEFPNRLLAFIGQRLGVRPEDPLTTAFPWLSDQDALDPRLLQWQASVRRWCRRHARFGLEALVRRRGRVHISRTHLDVCFDLSQVDVRVRRLALDVDPGWVPWLGRVVRFHYLQEPSCLPPA
jgi:hypothetical protein